MDEQRTVSHIGTVVRVENGEAVVRFLRTSACKSCGACLTAGESEMEVRVGDTLGVQPGDRVTVELSRKSMLTAAALCYLLPLAGLLIGVVLGSRINEWWAFGLGLGLCVLTLPVLRFADRRAKASGRFVPKLVSVVPNET